MPSVAQKPRASKIEKPTEKTGEGGKSKSDAKKSAPARRSSVTDGAPVGSKDLSLFVFWASRDD